MHVPGPFRVDDSAALYEFVQKYNFGQLVSQVEGRLFSTHLPFLFDKDRQTLTCHLARANPQWREIESQEVMVTFQGPHGYISPSWYTGPGVPTWNYQVVHAYGACRLLNENEVHHLLHELTEYHESQIASSWQVDYDPSMLKAIVGLEISVSEFQGKFKLSQNRSASDRQGVMENLSSPDLLEAMKHEGH